VPSYFFDHFCDLDCIALEANYDPQMQAESSRPRFLKRRIMGGDGHLSNFQALAANSQNAARHGGKSTSWEPRSVRTCAVLPTSLKMSRSQGFAIRSLMTRATIKACSNDGAEPAHLT